MDSKHQLEIMRRAAELGLDPARLNAAQYRRLSMNVRTSSELISDGTRAVSSRIATSLGLRNVSLAQSEHNKQVCIKNSCGSFSMLVDGTPVCKRCTCSGKWLESKWKDANEECPDFLWSNKSKQDAKSYIDGDGKGQTNG